MSGSNEQAGDGLTQVTMRYPGNERDYTSPFDVNVYAESEPYVEGQLGAFIGRGVVLGLERSENDGEEPEEGAMILQVDDSTGQRYTCPGFFFEVVPVDADTNLGPDTLRTTYEEYMSRPRTSASV